jgi:acyl-CoA synthetase (AMP-forming)/AMP-acid ligase II
MTISDVAAFCATDVKTRDNFITDGSFTVAYHELPALLDEAAAALAVAGIRPGDCLAVECANSVAGAVLLLTLMRDGYSFVLVPPAINADIKPVPLFCRFSIAVAAGIAPHPATDFLAVTENADWNGKTVPAAKLLLRTSGSMGVSKIVVHSHAALMGNAANCVRKYGFRAESRCTVPVPIAHMYGFGAEFLPAVQAGASIDLQDKTNVLKYLDREKKFQPTIAFVTPAICEMLLKGYKSVRTNYEVIVTSGQRISEDTFTAFDKMIDGKLINQYGSTEMGATAACDPGDSFELRCLTIGKPMHDVQLRIGDGTSGELSVLHPFGYDGYLDDTGAWIHVAEPGTWYRTGDLAEAGANGAIKVLGRAGASINRDGYLVLLEDIERIIEKSPGIAQVVVTVAPGTSARGPRIAAFCVAKDGVELDAQQIRARSFELLPRYAVPDEVHVMDVMPLLASGKVDRRSLAAELNQTEQ